MELKERDTSSTNFPMVNPLQRTNAGEYDAFVAKLSADGQTLVYSTYLGRGFDDGGVGIAVDGSGNAYVTGYTRSSNFPTANPLQATYAGEYDVFVTKLSADGQTLVYSTYLGGSATDSGQGIAVDGSGNAYVTGSTNSTNFPMANPLQRTNAGEYDAFVAKLCADGQTLLFSTYLGGSSGDYGLGIAVDGSGNAYVTGYTRSANFPTANPLQETNAGNWDAFVTKLSADGQTIVYSTYLGGSSYEEGYGIAVDSARNAYVTGVTGSSDFPTANPLQATYAGSSDAFVTKVSADGQTIVYSTYLGGSDYDVGLGIAADGAGNAYVTGRTYSSDFPTVNPVQGTWAGSSDAFVAKMSKVIDGQCGGADGGIFTTAPSNDLCASGTPSAVSGTGPWTWQCLGESGGADAACSADIQKYTITTVADPGAGGSVVCTPNPVNHGATSDCIVTTNPGYILQSVSGCGSGSLNGITYTTGAVTSACTVTATFTLKTYTISVTAGAGGSVSPGTTTVNYGSDLTFTITPDVGYHIKDVKVDGVSQGAITSYTFTNITADHTIEAAFEINSYTITATHGVGGGISPAGETSKTYGSSQTYTITPSPGYQIADVKVDGTSVGKVGTYEFTNITGGHSIEAYFSVVLPYQGAFSPGIEDLWDITNRDATKYSVTDVPGSLSLMTTPTELYDGINTLVNLFTVPLPTDATAYAVTAKIRFPVVPSFNFQQGGIILLGRGSIDLDNYIRASYGYSDGLKAMVSHDINGVPASFSATGFTPGTQPFWLRIIKDGNTYTAYYSANGVDFTRFFGPITQAWDIGHAGVFALHNLPSAPSLQVIFEAFDIRPLLNDIDVSPMGHDFGDVSVGQISQGKVFSISNKGTYPLTLNSIELSGTNTSHFDLQAAPCSNRTLAPTETCDVQVSFAPTTSGAKAAQVVITSDDTDESPVQIPVQGTGTATVRVTKAGSGGGTVTSTPAGIACGTVCTNAYTANVSVTLSAAPDESSVFAGWSGDCSGTGDCALTTETHRNVTATFTLKQYTMTSSAGTGGAITPSGTVTVNHGATQAYTITPNLYYAIQDVTVDGISVGAVSSYTFTNVTGNHTISATFVKTSITVTAPAGGEVWQPGTTQKITWVYSGTLGASVKIDLFKGGVFHSTITSRTSVGTRGNGSYSWAIPQALPQGDDYKVKVTSTSNASYTGMSLNNFSIKPPDPAITVTSPNGGETWAKGSSQTISWSYVGNVGSSVKIELLKGESPVRVIAESASIGSNGSGSYPWTVDPSLADGSDYKVRLTSVGSPSVGDVSNAPFSITTAPPVGLTVVVPNGGETWKVGTMQTIRWTFTGNPGTTVRIELLKGNTVSSTLATAAPIGSAGSGSFTWRVPVRQTTGDDFKIRLTSNGGQTDTSDGNFSITR